MLADFAPGLNSMPEIFQTLWAQLPKDTLGYMLISALADCRRSSLESFFWLLLLSQSLHPFPGLSAVTAEI